MYSGGSVANVSDCLTSTEPKVRSSLVEKIMQRLEGAWQLASEVKNNFKNVCVWLLLKADRQHFVGQQSNLLLRRIQIASNAVRWKLVGVVVRVAAGNFKLTREKWIKWSSCAWHCKFGIRNYESLGADNLWRDEFDSILLLGNPADSSYSSAVWCVTTWPECFNSHECGEAWNR